MTSPPADPSPWASLPGLVMGALLALGASLFVQTVVVPRAETRKRREQRWEGALNELGELTTSKGLDTLAIAARFSIATWIDWMAVDSPASEDMSPGDWEDLRDAVHKKAKDDSAAYLAATSPDRVDWLVARVRALAPESPAVREFNWAAQSYRRGGSWAEVWDYGGPDQPPTHERNDDEWDREERGRQEFTRHVIGLLDAKQPPRHNWWHRVSRRVTQRRAKLRNWWHDRR